MLAGKKLTMAEAVEKGLVSHDIAQDKREQLKQLFPEVFTDGKIDLDQLRRVVGDWIAPGKERYGLTWPGKADCMRVIQAPRVVTLKPDRGESIDFDDTHNVFIEGDNLEVLKLLQKAYFGEIKMIYIDPPYNTGREFIYPDRFQDPLETYLAYTRQSDHGGKRFSTNTEDSGWYHSAWLSMMYPRLYLARNLLRDDGVIFITIDDHEESNLSLLCDQVFGRENFRAKISWQKKYSVSNNFKGIASIRDFVLVYSKSDAFKNGLLPRSEESKARYYNPDNDPRGPWKPVDYWNVASVDARPNLVYEIVNPNTGKRVLPEKKAWKFSKEVHDEHVSDSRIWWGRDGGNEVPALKLFLSEVRDGMIPHNWWPHEEAGHTDEAKKHVDKLFGGASPFDTPKPTKLVERMLQIAGVESGDLVLDFFAGSCTTAEAVTRFAVGPGCALRYIMVQLPESCAEGSEAYKQGFGNIADVGKERIRRAIRALEKDGNGKVDSGDGGTLDLGFRVFRQSPSNFHIWEGGADQVEDLGGRLEDHVDHVRPDSEAEDILYELLLKAGFELTTNVARWTLAGQDVFAVADGALLICLEKEISPELIEAMADAAPLQVICLDEGFRGNDQLKANAVQTFKSRAREGAEAIVFRTV